jgi:hypothetical protein
MHWPVYTPLCCAVLCCCAVGCADLVYPAVKHSVIENCERSGAEIVEVPIPLPIKHAADVVAAVQKVRAVRLLTLLHALLLPQVLHVLCCVFAIRHVCTCPCAQALDAHSNVRVALFDHITSSTGLVLPVAELSALCAARGVLCVVDGAHAIGHVPIGLGAGQPLAPVDFYCSNFHKWLFAPKGSAFLYVKKQHQKWLQPVVTSHGTLCCAVLCCAVLCFERLCVELELN